MRHMAPNRHPTYREHGLPTPTSMRSSSGPGMVSSTLAVHTNSTCMGTMRQPFIGGGLCSRFFVKAAFGACVVCGGGVKCGSCPPKLPRKPDVDKASQAQHGRSLTRLRWATPHKPSMDGRTATHGHGQGLTSPAWTRPHKIEVGHTTQAQHGWPHRPTAHLGQVHWHIQVVAHEAAAHARTRADNDSFVCSSTQLTLDRSTGMSR